MVVPLKLITELMMTLRAVSKWANLSNGEIEFLIWTKHSLNAVNVDADIFLGLLEGSKGSI